MNDDLRIRLEFLRDLDEHKREALLDEIAALAFDDQQILFVSPPDMQVQRFREQPTRDTFAIMATVGAADAEQLIGVGSLQLVEDDDDPGQEGDLLYRGLAIEPGWQGRGVGTTTTALVLEAAAARYPDADSLFLAVHVDNPAGKRAYEKNGFVVAQRELFHTSKGDHYVMRAPITRD